MKIHVGLKLQLKHKCPIIITSLFNYKALKNFANTEQQISNSKSTKFCCCFYRLMPTELLWVCGKCIIIITTTSCKKTNLP